MEDTKIVVAGKPLVDFDCIRNMLGSIVEDAIDRYYTPAGRLVDPEKADQVVKDSVDRGTPTREIATASRYLMLAAVSICTDSMNAFEHYLDASEDYQRENAEYMVLDGRKAAAQIQSILGVMSELEGLEEH
nr:MAG TPA: LamB/YcsF family [Caudoviricetes sp.]